MKCPKCQFNNTESAKFCIECGYKFGEQLATEGERKQVTVLFSDLSGYTAMSERLDPEEVKNIISRIFGEIARVVVKYDGSIEKFIGDAVVAFFGVPKAHEDDPVRALRAAREIRAHDNLRNARETQRMMTVDKGRFKSIIGIVGWMKTFSMIFKIRPLQIWFDR
jgi:class 3 adenylate cyclase